MPNAIHYNSNEFTLPTTSYECNVVIRSVLFFLFATLSFHVCIALVSRKMVCSSRSCSRLAETNILLFSKTYALTFTRDDVYVAWSLDDDRDDEEYGDVVFVVLVVVLLLLCFSALHYCFSSSDLIALLQNDEVYTFRLVVNDFFDDTFYYYSYYFFY